MVKSCRARQSKAKQRIAAHGSGSRRDGAQSTDLRSSAVEISLLAHAPTEGVEGWFLIVEPVSDSEAPQRVESD
jgi:hypothetical protein